MLPGLRSRWISPAAWAAPAPGRWRRGATSLPARRAAPGLRGGPGHCSRGPVPGRGSTCRRAARLHGWRRRWMVDAGGRLGLAQAAPPGRVVVGHRLRQHLDRHLPQQHGIRRLVDDAHAAPPSRLVSRYFPRYLPTRASAAASGPDPGAAHILAFAKETTASGRWEGSDMRCSAFFGGR